MGFKGKVVFVTGSTSGIGREVAIQFARQGARVAVTGQNKERLSETIQQCLEVGLSSDQVVGIDGDLSKDEDIEKVFRHVIQHFGTLDILVNSAAMGQHCKFEEDSVHFLDAVYRTNFRAPWELSRLAVPGTSPYSCMKAALDHLTRINAHELAHRGIRVNSVNPAYVRTPLLEKLANAVGHGDKEKGFTVLADVHPIGRMGTTEQVAKAVLYLASDDGGTMTGSNLLMDGGASLAGASLFIPDTQ